ncbi:Spc98 family-domain-containing protein [Microdochium trichocladiopsis]|uniref:Spindle pole body component n=1 Tax=Microdochium trichocladiopsis TaxID=1682393 RepID=A0A9P9BPJ7_9PEZI|nr:Spc98 family-domain-containing protein [Microdochium trichocladiopsis]KAH7033204.1 Spc98 family-domain-containing protein [Microdochium trichocladiopsis]
MAYAAQLSALTDELIGTIVTSTSDQDPALLQTVRESSLQRLRHHTRLRTNQFEVYKQLEGLEERLHVVNRDGLADALGSRMARLSSLDLKWLPDALHFLLELSDKPVEKSKLADLELLKPPEVVPEPGLTWDEIAKEDGWADDRHLWDSVDFGNDSSDEYLGSDSASDNEADKAQGSDDTTASVSVQNQYFRRPDDLIIHIQDELGLERVVQTQQWRKVASDMRTGTPQAHMMSEAQAVREVLFMLRGLKTSIFDHDGRPVPHVRLSHTSEPVLREALTNLGQIGRQFSLLRAFAKEKHKLPLIQVFQDAVDSRLKEFDSMSADYERRLVDVSNSIVVSLTKIVHDLGPRIQPLSALSEVVSQFLEAKYPHPFRYLELLFDSAANAQLEGRAQAYEFLATIFLTCFKVYLRPIRLWMESGEIDISDKVFFISSTAARLPSHQVWRDQYKLRVSQDGTLVVPRFLHPSIANIFNAGKSIVMLKLLGRHYSCDHSQEPSLDFAAITAGDIDNFAPFPEVFSEAFEAWIESKHHAAYATLRTVLLGSCRLIVEIDSLHSVFLMTDGSRSGLLAVSIFHNLDLLNANWHDRLALSQVAQEAFESKIDASRLAVSVPAMELKNDVAKTRTSVRLGLPLVRVTYHLPWPLRIVITDTSLGHYQAVFTFLLQLRRASYVLHRHKPLADGVADLSQDQTAYYRVRMRLLWFCSVIDTYITTLVIGPLAAQLRSDLEQAKDIDAMISVHSSFAKRMIDEVCLGTRLDPIRQCILDVLDLAIKLEDARQSEAQREAEATQELSRLSTYSSPAKPNRPQRYMQASEEEDQTFLEEQDKSKLYEQDDSDDDDEAGAKDYYRTLMDMADELDRHMKFLCSGLRGVARASTNSAAAKWDTLAEMLEFGVLEPRSFAL